MFRTHGWVVAVGAIFATSGSGSARGGLSPENVIVVVNSAVDHSGRIADAYMAGRNVPVGNRIELSDVPSDLQIGVDDFRTKILQPLLSEIDRRKLAAQARVIAYSSGFPTAVGVGKLHAKWEGGGLKKYQRPIASLTGATYLYMLVAADNPEIFSLGSNLYARGPKAKTFVNPFFDDATAERYRAAEAFADEGDHGEAAEGYLELAGEFPLNAPLWVAAASQLSEAERDDEAKRALRLAVAAGWSDRKHLMDASELRRISAGVIAGLADRINPPASQPPIPFNAAGEWLRNGWPGAVSNGQPGKGIRYLMATSLTVVRVRGSTPTRAIESLRRAATSESVEPGGRFVFMQSGDIRTKTRKNAIPPAEEYLEQLGRPPLTLRGQMPTFAGRIAGLMIGSPKMPMAGAAWEFVPGALAENLTSLSAAYGSQSQDKISRLLDAGAAFSCGPVAEPFTLPPKFPTPTTYGYYAAGFSVIEAVYQGVASPYQTLCVGDPLCQPFAPRPKTGAGYRRGDDRWQFAAVCQHPTVAQEIYFDGRLVRSFPPKKRFEVRFDGATETPEEVRVVFVLDDVARTRRSIVAKDLTGGSEKPKADKEAAGPPASP